MRPRLDPVRFIGHIVLASVGSGLGMIVTFLVVWNLSGNAGPFSSGATMSSFVIGLVALLPLIVPGTFCLLIAAYAIRARVPVIEPGGVGMLLILGALGIGLNILLAVLIGVADRGEVGPYLLLAVSVGGALGGVIVAWRMKK